MINRKYARHVILPKILAKWLPHQGILKEEEWTSLGVSQSSGWEHFMVYGICICPLFFFCHRLILFL